MTFSATVSSAAGTPAGSVTFASDATTLGTVSLTGGQATLATPALPAGNHTITASYGGDVTMNLAPSTGTLTQPVAKAANATSLTSSLNPSAAGQAVAFTAIVASAAGMPTGTVTFASDATTLGTVSLTNGQTTLVSSALAVGNHPITAVYSGDANFQTGSAALTQAVNPPVEGLADPELSPLMAALSNSITDSNGNAIIGLSPPCAMTGPYQGLSDLDKLAYSAQANDGCLQFVTTDTDPPAGP